MTKDQYISKLQVELEIEKKKSEIYEREMNYYKKLYIESNNWLVDDHIPRID